MRNRGLLTLLLTAVALSSVAAVGCGDDDDGDQGAATTAPTTAAETTITMGDFFFDPKDVTAEAGTVTISAPNEGKVVHELVVFKSDADPASLPVSGGEIDEDALAKEGSELVSEIEDVEPGATKEGSFDFTAGKYVMFCNLPGHYEQGMYGSVTVE